MMEVTERCPACGAAYRQNVAFCVSCGLPRAVATPEPAAEAAPVAEEVAPEPVAQEAMTEPAVTEAAPVAAVEAGASAAEEAAPAEVAPMAAEVAPMAAEVAPMAAEEVTPEPAVEEAAPVPVDHLERSAPITALAEETTPAPAVAPTPAPTAEAPTAEAPTAEAPTPAAAPQQHWSPAVAPVVVILAIALFVILFALARSGMIF